VTVVDDFQAATEELASSAQSKVLAVYAQWKAGEITQEQAELAIAGIINRTNASAVSLADVYLVAQIEDAAGVVTPTAGIAPTDDAERLVTAVHTIFSEPPKKKITAAEARQFFRDFGLDPDDYDIREAVKNANYSIRQSISDMADVSDDDSPRDRIAAFNEYGRLMGVDFLEGAVEEIDTPESNALFDRLQNGEFDGLPAVWEHAPDAADTRLERLARAETFNAAQQGTHDAMQRQEGVEGWVRSMDADPCQLCRWWWREGKVWPKVHPFQRHKGCNCQPRVVIRKHIASTGFSRRYERNRAS
jgi:hypothetical protein